MTGTRRTRGRALLIPALALFSAAFAGTAAAAPLPDPRFGQAVASLPNGKILVVGGIDGTGETLNTAEILDTTRGSEYVPSSTLPLIPSIPVVQAPAVSAAASMSFARSSATITVLPTGNVLVTGGWDDGVIDHQPAGARSDAEIYNPAANTWTVIGGMSKGRFNHTATLLNNGKVLVCGGQLGVSLVPAATVTASCDLFTPSGASGAFTPTTSLAQARALHTATLLNDGTVWIVGGWNPNPTISGGPFLVTGERFNPTTNLFQQTVPLAAARAYHTATLTGDNKVFVAGGYNAMSLLDPNGLPTNGNLSSTEIFDPIGGGAGTDVAGPPMQALMQSHSATLLPNGWVSIYGGLGMIPSTLFGNLPTTFDGSAVVGAGPTASYDPSASPPRNPIYLGTPVTGMIMDGVINFYNVTLSTNGVTYNVPFAQASLNGVTVGCDLNATCGYITSDLTFTTITGIPNGIPIGGAGFAFPVSPATYAIVVVGHMVFSDHEYYVPSLNETSFYPPESAKPARPEYQRFGSSAVLTPTGVEWDIGGELWNGASFVPGNCGPYPLFCPGSGARADNVNYWTVAQTNAGANADPLIHAYHTANLLPNGTIVVAGGTNGTSVITSAEIFNPATQSFTPTASPMTVPREQHTATLMPNGRVLIAGGLTTASSSTTNVPVNSAEIYYPDSGFFLPAAPMISSHSQHIALELPNGNIFVAGGFSGFSGGALTVTNIAEIYQSTTNTWIPAASMPNAPNGQPGRAIAAAVELRDGTIFVCGGTNSGGDLGDSLIYNPATNVWTTLPLDPLPAGTVLQGHTATLLRDGRVLIAGGDNGFGQTLTTFIYNPSAPAGQRWSYGNYVGTPGRYGHSATLLPNGTVMISGGIALNLTGNPVANALPYEQSFYPDFDGWGSSTTFSLGARSFHTATLALDGNVYFIGGTNGSINLNQSTRFYTKYESVYMTFNPDQYSINSNPSLRQSTITFAGVAGAAAPTTFLPGAQFTATGQRFRGATEATGGGPASTSNGPHLQLQRIDGSSGGSSSSPGFLVNLTTQAYANPANLATMDSNLIVPLPATNAGLPTGWYMTWIGANDIFPKQAPLVQVGPPKPTLAPTSVTGTPLGISSITWTWSAIPGVDGYNVYQATGLVFLGRVGPVASPSLTVTSLAPNSRMQVYVAGYTLSGDGPSTLSPFATLPHTGVVNAVSCGPNNSGDTTTSIAWSWTDAGSVTNYNIYNSTTGLLLATAPNGNPTFHDTGLGINTPRTIQVAAVAGGVIGPLGGPTTCYTLAATPGAGFPLMTSTSAASVSVNWTLSNNPPGTNYEAVFTNYASTPIVVTTVTTTGSSAGLNGLKPDTFISATVVAVNGAGAFSTPLIAGTTFTLPTQPGPLTILGTTASSIYGEWSPNSNSTMTYYQLTYSVDDFATDVSTAIYFSSHFASTTFKIAGLLTSTTYFIRVQGENYFGQTSAYSAPVAASPNNGGAPPGSLAGILTSVGATEFSGTLGGPSERFVDVRSPGGAFPVNTDVTLSTYSLSDPGHSVCPGAIGGANGAGVAVSIIDNPELQPDLPIFLTMNFTPAEAASFPVPTSQLALARFDPASGTCVPLLTSFGASTFLAQLNHFSVYELIAAPLWTSADSARIYPNPFHAATDGYVTFDEMPPSSRVRVFTLRGDKVFDQDADGAGHVTWTAVNASGRPVASGLYIVTVESGGTKKIMKLAVIR
ncbi:MAG: kelch repeat-containing protein [Elusimicrobiota bacterium]